MCLSPCDRRLPPDVVYRIDGAGVQPSGEFRLRRNLGPRVRLEVKPALAAPHMAGAASASCGASASCSPAGIGLLVGGGVLVVAGLLVYGFSDETGVLQRRAADIEE